MDYQSFKSGVIAAAQELGIEEYELYYQSGAETSVGVFADAVKEFSSSESGGVCLRCIVDGKMGYASTEALSPEEAQAVVRRAVDNARALESKEQVFLCGGGQTYQPVREASYALPSTEALIQTALSVQRALYAADPMVIDGCETQAISEESRIAICNSKGLDLSCENRISALVVAAVVSDGKEMADAYEIRLGCLDTMDTDTMVAKAVSQAKCKLGGALPDSGTMPVIFSSEAMCSLLGVYSSVFSAESAQKGLSRLSGREGQAIAASCVTLMDDPFHPDSPAPRSFDAEGCPTATKAVIDRGVLTTLLHNMKTAAVAGTQTTGNASKAGYDAPVGIRPFTMYLAPGTLSAQQLLEKAGNGVYITELGGLHAGANPISGDFSLQSSGFQIENGQKTDYIRSFTVAGNFYELLRHIEALSDHCQLPRAMGVTAFGSPDVLVSGLSIAGK